MEGVSKERFIQDKLVLAPQSGCPAVLHRLYGIRAAYYVVSVAAGYPGEPRSQVAITQGGNCTLLMSAISSSPSSRMTILLLGSPSCVNMWPVVAFRLIGGRREGVFTLLSPLVSGPSANINSSSIVGAIRAGVITRLPLLSAGTSAQTASLSPISSWGVVADVEEHGVLLGLGRCCGGCIACSFISGLIRPLLSRIIGSRFITFRNLDGSKMVESLLNLQSSIVILYLRNLPFHMRSTSFGVTGPRAISVLLPGATPATLGVSEACVISSAYIDASGQKTRPLVRRFACSIPALICEMSSSDSFFRMVVLPELSRPSTKSLASWSV